MANEEELIALQQRAAASMRKATELVNRAEGRFNRRRLLVAGDDAVRRAKVLLLDSLAILSDWQCRAQGKAVTK